MEAFQLIAVAKTNDIRVYGVEFLLQPFLNEIDILSVCSLKLACFSVCAITVKLIDFVDGPHIHHTWN